MMDGVQKIIGAHVSIARLSEDWQTNRILGAANSLWDRGRLNRAMGDKNSGEQKQFYKK